MNLIWFRFATHILKKMYKYLCLCYFCVYVKEKDIK